MEINFQTTDEEFDLIQQIVDRAVELSLTKDRMSTHMDVVAVHKNGNPLRLADLLAADEFNFIHDIAGIYRHLDRDTGELRDFFSPRFSDNSTEAA